MRTYVWLQELIPSFRFRFSLVTEFLGLGTAKTYRTVHIPKRREADIGNSKRGIRGGCLNLSTCNYSWVTYVTRQPKSLKPALFKTT